MSISLLKYYGLQKIYIYKVHLVYKLVRSPPEVQIVLQYLKCIYIFETSHLVVVRKSLIK